MNIDNIIVFLKRHFSFSCNLKMDEQYKNTFWLIIAIPCLLILYSIFSDGNPFSSKYEQAIKSIEYISDTVKWFIAIQAGILGFIGNLILKSDNKDVLIQQFFRPIIFWSISILCGAWVLTGLPSIILRLADPKYCTNFDVLLMPIYSWLPSFLSLSFFYSLLHWYWALGIISFGVSFIEEKNITKKSS